MKTQPTHLLRLLSMILMIGALSSCQLPPRYAMREIQSKGLFNYLSTDYSSVSPRYYASAAPFQLQRPYAQPRPVNQIPYRSTYHSNRHLKADYNQVPYRPKKVVSSSAPSRTRSYRDYDDVTPSPTPKPLVTSRPTESAPDKPVAAAPKTTAPASPEAASKAEEVLPYGTPVAGRPGMVVSPYTDATKKQLVDVTGLAAGEKVKDPYSGKLFRVPPTQQAANQAGSTEKKPDAPVEEEAAGAKPKP
jgi:hypothetical protein